MHGGLIVGLALCATPELVICAFLARQLAWPAVLCRGRRLFTDGRSGSASPAIVSLEAREMGSMPCGWRLGGQSVPRPLTGSSCQFAEAAKAASANAPDHVRVGERLCTSGTADGNDRGRDRLGHPWRGADSIA